MKKLVFIIVFVLLCTSLPVAAFAADYYATAHEWNGSSDGYTMAATESAGYTFIINNGKKGAVMWQNMQNPALGVVIDGLTIDFSYSYIIQYGSTGSKVSAVQKALYNLGYTSLSIDGVFGTQTENAVRSFQTYNGLTVDGVVGSETYKQLCTYGVY